VLTNAAGHTIQGAGQLGRNFMGLLNQGLILANQSTALTIDPTDSLGVTNTGTLEAASGGTLALTGGLFTNTGGLIVAAADGTVLVNNAATVSGGTVRAASGGTLQLNGGGLIAAGTTIDVPSGGTLQLRGGTITGGTLSGAGTLTTTNGTTSTLNAVTLGTG